MKRIQIRTALLFSLMLIVFLGLNTLNAQGGNGEISLSWAAVEPSSPGLQVWYGLEIQIEAGTNTWKQYKTSATSYTFTGLTVGTTYSWYMDIYSCTASEASGYTNGQTGVPTCAARTQQGPSDDDVAINPSPPTATPTAPPTATATRSRPTPVPPTPDPNAKPPLIPTATPRDTSGSISFSWPAAKDPEGGKIWYWVHFANGSEITDKRSITFSGLESGRQYNWDVDAYSCLPGEVVLSGCSKISQQNDPHASGVAVSRGRRSSSRSGDSGSNGGSSSGGSGGGGGAAAVSEAPAPLPEFYHDHNVSVTCPAAGFCSPNYQKLTNSMVGSVDIIEQGILSTTNVWGAVPAGTRVCFIGKTGGGVMFKDSSITPHPISWLAHYMLGGDTCVDIPGEGTVTLVRGGGSAPVSASPPEAPVSPPPIQQLPAPICQIKLDDTLFLRATPNGQIIGLVWLNSEVPVFTVDGHWYQVEFEGLVGYISRYHRRVLSGSC